MSNKCNELKRLENTIYYGVTGCGKSHAIEEHLQRSVTLDTVNETDTIVYEKIAFHPDYTYADFVGQNISIVNPLSGKVEYEFTPGPFTRLLRQAVINPHKDFYLVVEDINRGNAAAIFGDMMHILGGGTQLSPKVVDGQVMTLYEGLHFVHNAAVAKAVYGNPDAEVHMPCNFAVLATMNTSLPNTYALDSAFLGRFKMVAVENDFSREIDIYGNGHPYADMRIMDSHITWQAFCECINKIIAENKSRMLTVEDKRLGIYFVNPKELALNFQIDPNPQYRNYYEERRALSKIPNESRPAWFNERWYLLNRYLMEARVFPEKVIRYLWDDVFRFNPEVLFDTEIVFDAEQAIRLFASSYGNDRFKVFRSSVQKLLFESN